MSSGGSIVTNRPLALVALASCIFMAPAARAAEPVSTAAASQKETKWEELVPRDWDPTRQFKNANAAGMSDSNPKVLQMMREMREAFDNAPTNEKMDGASVKLPGYIVPLDEVNGELREFLLVPYFGACIHTPPPPANQIVHVVTEKPVKGFRMMDAVWVTGTLKTTRLDTAMGTSGYRIQPVAIDRYVAPSRP
ncbi:MAG: DUF3299 domain-containing protein [Rhizobiales bacterium]|nr:DUF3299 domain-containing protein [Rhizobacter sp.]